MPRETAARIPLTELEKADVMESADDFSGNYTLSKSNFRISRASIWGIAIKKGFEQSNDIIELDDFTGKIKCIIPEELSHQSDKISIGEPVKAIGKLMDRKGTAIFIESIKPLMFGEELLKRADNIYSLREMKKKAEQSGKNPKENSSESTEEKTKNKEKEFEEEGIVIERRKI